MFERIAQLAKFAAKFPEFELEFQTMILKLAEIKPNAKRATNEELNECRKIYESEGKLYAVKYWKFHFNIGLIDAKHQVEDLAAKYFWILPQDR